MPNTLLLITNENINIFFRQMPSFSDVQNHYLYWHIHAMLACILWTVPGTEIILQYAQLILESYKTTIYKVCFICTNITCMHNTHSISDDDVIKWKHFPRNWPFVRGIHRSPVNSPHKGQWRGALMFSLICVWINDWINNPEAGDLRRHQAHFDVSVMILMVDGQNAASGFDGTLENVFN